MAVTFGVGLHNLGFGLGQVRPEDHRSIVLDIAQQAEELGFHSVWAGDHVALPGNPSKPYPYSHGGDYRIPSNLPLLDPIATLAVVAGRTRRVKLGFGVLILPYRHPLITAKLLSTIDVLSNGRLILGVGTRWVSLALVPILLGATWVHSGNGWVFSAENGGWEYPAFLTLAAVVQALLGPGAFALRFPVRQQAATA